MCFDPEDKEDPALVSQCAQANADKKVVDPPLTQRFLHCTYVPFPGDAQPVQTDVVLYGRLAAKIFIDQLDPKIVRAWCHEDVTWVSWTSRQVMTVGVGLLSVISSRAVLFASYFKVSVCIFVHLFPFSIFHCSQLLLNWLLLSFSQCNFNLYIAVLCNVLFWIGSYLLQYQQLCHWR